MLRGFAGALRLDEEATSYLIGLAGAPAPATTRVGLATASAR
ncbi:hypothetical protein [Streptomyces sp. NPDC086010]